MESFAITAYILFCLGVALAAVDEMKNRGYSFFPLLVLFLMALGWAPLLAGWYIIKGDRA